MEKDLKIPQIQLDDRYKFLDPVGGVALFCFFLDWAVKQGWIPSQTGWVVGASAVLVSIMVSIFIYRRYNLGYGRGHNPHKLRWPHLFLPGSGIIAAGLAYNVHFISIGWAVVIAAICTALLLFIGYKTVPDP